jgi:hypothetical protein
MNTPANMHEVNKDEFYAVIGPQDVHPATANPDCTIWETPTRQVVGWSYPGWRNPGEPKRYALPNR